ncbi:MAG: hypothetical protein GEU74_02900 [Nitriliruptorales bacterium]|nr:hypothetical protein [Nitriliruptorales bacterium]
MRVRLTDQAAVAVALARQVAGDNPATVAHLLVGLAGESEGRAGRRLRERPTAAAALCERAPHTAAPALEFALKQAARGAGRRAAGTVDLLDAALAHAGPELTTLLSEVGYQRDLDGWLAMDPDVDWYEDAETMGWSPGGDEMFDSSASRVVAQVRAVGGGAVETVIAAAAAPDGDIGTVDPAVLAATAARVGGASPRWDTGLDAVITAAGTLSDGPAVSVSDLFRAAIVAGGDGPRVVLEVSGGGS